jgi:hypothetical protein
MKTLKTIIFISIILIYGAYGFAGDNGFPCEENTAFQNWVGNGYKVIVCSYGSAPVKFKKNWWRGNGLSFYKVQNSKRELIKDHSEYYPDLDYSYKDDTLTFIIYTYQPKKSKGMFDQIPFIRETVRLNRDKPKVSRMLLLKRPQPDAKMVDELFSTLSLPKQKFVERYPSPDEQGHAIGYSLYMLRNYGLLDPIGISTRLSQLGLPWWFDGESGGMYRDVQAELRIIKALSKQ